MAGGGWVGCGVLGGYQAGGWAGDELLEEGGEGEWRKVGIGGEGC